MNEQLENLNREMTTIKNGDSRAQKHNNWNENSLHGFKSRAEQAEGKKPANWKFV